MMLPIACYCKNTQTFDNPFCPLSTLCDLSLVFVALYMSKASFKYYNLPFILCDHYQNALCKFLNATIILNSMSEISIPTFPGPPKMKHTQNINNFETK